MIKANPASMLVPGDFDSELEALATKKKLYEAMIAQGLGPEKQGQMVSGHYVAPSWSEHLAKLGTAYMGKSGLDETTAASADINKRQQVGLGEALGQYLQIKNGQNTSMSGGTLPTGEQAPDIQMATAADPKKAIIEAMASQYKPLRDIGSAEFAQLGRKNQNALSQKDILTLAGDKFSPESARKAALSGNIEDLEAPMKTHVINGQLVREDPVGGSRRAGDYRDTFNGVAPVGFDPSGKPIMGQSEATTGKVTFAPQGTTVNVDTGKKGADAFATHAGEAAVKDLVTSTDSARKAQQSLETFQNAKSQLANVKGGSGAELILGAKKLAQQLGVPLDDSISSIEQVQAALGQGVLDNAKTLGSGSGFSNTDREFLEKIVLGKISLDENTLKRAVNLGIASNLNALRDHEHKLTKAQNIEGADPAVLDQFQVPVPHFSLDAKEFNYDPITRRVSVQPTGGGASGLPGKQMAPTASTSGLTAAEQSELAELRKWNAGRK